MCGVYMCVCMLCVDGDVFEMCCLFGGVVVFDVLRWFCDFLSVVLVFDY